MTETRALVVGVDGSASSTAALDWAAGEAERRHLPLRVVHAFTIPVYGGDGGVEVLYSSADIDAARAHHESLVAEQVEPARAGHPGLAVETRVHTGPATAVLLEEAQTADLVVLGSRGAGSLAALMLGSVAHAVSHRSPCPVVLVSGKAGHPDVRRIVVGTDGSSASAEAVDWAAREATLWDAELTVVHVWDHPYVGVRTGPSEPVELMELDAAKVLASSVEMLRSRGGALPRLHAELVEGSPSAKLIELAADADLLVVGARGRGVLRAAILGSTSNQLIHHAPCPIAVVHSR